ncbi:MAG: zinc-ribbon domain-containing protein [Clostridiaceae bacterium]|jgi:hypothetical protein|nr:zinc-ribbon domain-containing protein [Clostridiaceae bacterium]
MFIVFGWGRQTLKSFGPVLKYHCDHCHNEKHWVLYCKRTWFTLFFIPIIPYSTEYLMLCPICKYGVKLEKDKFEEYKAIALCNTDLINKAITQQEHAARMDELLSPTLNKNTDDADWAGKTETQKNYLRQLKEIEEERAARAAMSAGSQEPAYTESTTEEAGGN